MKDIVINLIDYISLFDISASDTYRYTGHTHYMSPYECDDNCGTCDGARCDRCTKIRDIYRFEKNLSLENLIRIFRKECGVTSYIPDYNWFKIFYEEKFLNWINSEEKELEQLDAIFLQQNFILKNFFKDDVPKWYLANVYYINFPNNGRLYIKDYNEAKIIANEVGAKIYSDIYCNLDKSALFIEVEKIIGRS